MSSLPGEESHIGSFLSTRPLTITHVGPLRATVLLSTVSATRVQPWSENITRKIPESNSSEVFRCTAYLGEESVLPKFPGQSPSGSERCDWCWRQSPGRWFPRRTRRTRHSGTVLPPLWGLDTHVHSRELHHPLRGSATRSPSFAQWPSRTRSCSGTPPSWPLSPVAWCPEAPCSRGLG